jgi:hypothetical protein
VPGAAGRLRPPDLPAALGRGAVKPGEPMKPFWRSNEAILPEHEAGVKRISANQQPLIKQGGSIMWDIIISLFYHQARKRYVAAARRPWALWA